jgi:hypothetical protein
MEEEERKSPGRPASKTDQGCAERRDGGWGAARHHITEAGSGTRSEPMWPQARRRQSLARLPKSPTPMLTDKLTFFATDPFSGTRGMECGTAILKCSSRQCEEAHIRPVPYSSRIFIPEMPASMTRPPSAPVNSPGCRDWVSLALSCSAVACIGLLSRRSLKLKANDVWHGPPRSALAS